MAGPTSITEIDLVPIPGKAYWNTVREWREEFIYFLLIDRFHDDRNRAPVPTSARADRVDKDTLARWPFPAFSPIRKFW